MEGAMVSLDCGFPFLPAGWVIGPVREIGRLAVRWQAILG